MDSAKIDFKTMEPATIVSAQTMYSATKDPKTMKSATTHLAAMDPAAMDLSTTDTAKIHTDKWTPQLWT